MAKAKRENTASRAKSATKPDASIYLSIVARDHDEFVRKIADLYAAFVGPVPETTKAACHAAA